MTTHKVTLGDILRKIPVLAFDGFETVETALGAMKKSRRRAVGVLIGDRFAGLFTDGDFLSRVVNEGRNALSTKLHSVMTAGPLTAGPEVCIHKAFDMMGTHGYGYLPVIDKNGAYIGIVSERDLRPHVLEGMRTIATERDYLKALVAGHYSL